MLGEQVSETAAVPLLYVPSLIACPVPYLKVVMKFTSKSVSHVHEAHTTPVRHKGGQVVCFYLEIFE